MTQAIHFENDIVEATGRLSVYSLLATGFMFPTRDRIEVLWSTLLPAVSILDLGIELNAAAEALAQSVPADIGPFRRHYMELFPPVASQDAPGYETGYRGEGVFQQTTIMADIGGFYRAHGLRAGGEERERLDHITVELEFLAVVAKKEVLALRNGNRDRGLICRETAAKFLSDHLGCWGRSFGLRVSSVSADRWYRALGELLILWIEADLGFLGVQPVEIADSPIPQPPTDDGSCGPCPSPGPGVSI